ncbi:MAG TPA: GGDEF domain-containing protein [Gaiellaceae bacterium]|nr:GGDEF domain-containing protein [Gaiellaceae bacterium]
MARFPPRAARGRLALILWTVILATVVVLATAWVAGAIAENQERDAVDMRLAANLLAGREELATTLAEADARAEELAASPAVQRALADADRAAAAEIVAGQEAVGLLADDRLLAGTDSWPASRTVEVADEDGATVGAVVAGVPLDERTADRLADVAMPFETDVMAIADGDRILGASSRLVPGTPIPETEDGRLEQNDASYRFVSVSLLEGTDTRLVALSPYEPIEAAAADTRRRALFAALATLALVALLTWTLTRLLGRRAPAPAPAPVHEDVRRRRRAADARNGAESERVREAVALVGDALAATHDPEALLPVILQSAIGATGAVGARLVSGGTEVVRAGEPEEGGKPLSLRLGGEDDGIGRLLLYPPRGGAFDGEAEQLAHWLAAQASIAIENERLHRTVKRQAITDELTQLANRRRFTETLSVEVRRADRFGDPLALVLADIDDFKQINDRYGHAAGDEVLRRFADVLRENVRDFDLPVRYGGEEFAVLLPETGLDGGEQLARRLQTALLRLRLPEIAADRPPVTASFGVAAFPAAASAEALLSAADEALYQAKAAGKNRVTSAGEAGGGAA